MAELSECFRDSAWLQMYHLNQDTVLDYFSNSQFYDRTCNNEIAKMQQLSSDQMKQMRGVEYALIHMQEPVLYVVSKQNRQGLRSVTPLALYYVVAGTVFRAPDLFTLVNNRLLSSIHHLRAAMDEARSYQDYRPGLGYSWDFKLMMPNVDGDSSLTKDDDVESSKSYRKDSPADRAASKEAGDEVDGEVDGRGIWEGEQFRSVDTLLRSLYSNFPPNEYTELT